MFHFAMDHLITASSYIDVCVYIVLGAYVNMFLGKGII